MNNFKEKVLILLEEWIIPGAFLALLLLSGLLFIAWLMS